MPNNDTYCADCSCSRCRIQTLVQQVDSLMEERAKMGDEIRHLREALQNARHPPRLPSHA